MTVGETEFHISLSRSSGSPGRYVFIVSNNGTTTHALGIRGPGVDTSSSDIAPGGSSRLTVTLSKGSYDIYCPVANHQMLGMNRGLSIS